MRYVLVTSMVLVSVNTPLGVTTLKKTVESTVVIVKVPVPGCSGSVTKTSEPIWVPSLRNRTNQPLPPAVFSVYIPTLSLLEFGPIVTFCTLITA
jgi:hypothetical protein